MEIEKQKEEQTKKRFLNRKVLGIPMMLFLIMGIGLVLAVGGYYYYFSQIIHVNVTINHQPVHAHNINNQLVITGDLEPQLNCTAGEYCNTQNISITNPTTDEQIVNIYVSNMYRDGYGYYPGVDSACLEGDLGTCYLGDNNITIQPNSTVTFRVKYHLFDIPGQIQNLNCTIGQPCVTTDYPINAWAQIIISSNMTEY